MKKERNLDNYEMTDCKELIRKITLKQIDLMGKLLQFEVFCDSNILYNQKWERWKIKH